MFRSLLLAAAMLSSTGLEAQQLSLAGPVPGFIFDPPGKSIRAINGALGSSTLGPPLIGRLDFASVAPRQNYGIAVREGNLLLLTGVGTSQFSTSDLAALSFLPEGAGWSDDGSTIVLYSRSTGSIQVLSSFPSSVNVAAPIAVNSLTSVAVDPHGKRIIVGTGGDQAGVFQVNAGQSLSLLLSVAAPISLAFSSDGATFYVLDQATDQVFEIDLATSGYQSWPAGVDNATAIRAAAVVLYAVGSQALVAVSRTSHLPIATVPLSFAPSIIEPVGSNGFLLNRRSTSGDLLWTFTGGEQPVVFFVPVPAIPTGPKEAGRK